MTTSATRSLHFMIALSAVVVLDRVAKLIVARDISLHENIQMIPGFFRLTHVENRGAALACSPIPFRMEDRRAGFIFDCRAGHRFCSSVAAFDATTGIGLALILERAVGKLSGPLLSGRVVDFLFSMSANINGRLST